MPQTLQTNLEQCVGDGTSKLVAELSRAESLYPLAMMTSNFRCGNRSDMEFQACGCDPDGAHGRTQRVTARAVVRA